MQLNRQTHLLPSSVHAAGRSGRKKTWVLLECMAPANRLRYTGCPTVGMIRDVTTANSSTGVETIVVGFRCLSLVELLFLLVSKLFCSKLELFEKSNSRSDCSNNPKPEPGGKCRSQHGSPKWHLALEKPTTMLR